MSEKRSGEDNEAAGANGQQPAKQQRIENDTNSNLASSSSSSAASVAATGSGSAINITPAKPPSNVLFTAPTSFLQFSVAPLPVQKAPFGTIAPVDSPLETLTRSYGFSAAGLELNGPTKYNQESKMVELSRDTLMDIGLGALMRVPRNSTTPMHIASHYSQVVPYNISFHDNKKTTYGTSQWRFEENATESTLKYDTSMHVQMPISMMPPSYREQLLNYMAVFKQYEADISKHPFQLFGDPDPNSSHPGYVLGRIWLWAEWVPEFLSMLDKIHSELAEGGVLMMIGKQFRLHRDYVSNAKGTTDNGWYITPQKAFAKQQGVSKIGMFGFLRSTEEGGMKFISINPPVVSAFGSKKASGGKHTSSSSSSSSSSSGF